MARRVARQEHPTATPERIESIAKDGWEKSAVNFLVQTLKVGKTLRPNARWGFWDLVPGGHVDWSITVSDPDTKKNLEPLWEAVDALCKSKLMHCCPLQAIGVDLAIFSCPCQPLC